MAMDWPNEWWVRLYTRDTTTWKLLSWEARSVLMHMFRKVDRSGVLDVGDDGVLGLAAILEIPEEVVAAHLPALIKRGAVEFVGSAYILPNFIEAQEAPSSDKQRQRVSRASRRDRARSGDSVTIRDSESQDVTECHERSHAVTIGHSEREEREQTEEREEREALPAAPAPLALIASDPPAPKLDPIDALWSEQERMRAEVIPGCRPLRLTDDRRKLVRDARKAGYSDDDLRAALAACAAEVKRDPSSARWFNGETNWRPKSIAFRLGSIGTSHAPPGAHARPALGQAHVSPTAVHVDGDQAL